MADKPVDTTPRGWLSAVYSWLGGSAPTHSPHPVVPPADTPRAERSRIGHYEILQKIGEGGMGVVYRARDERLERIVALKTMATPAADDETARKRFWREARAAASVNHPNICQIYEIGEDGSELFIAMELLEGEPLADRLRTGAMSVSQAVPLALGMLNALSALHGRGVVHRDLKPSNVFLTPHGVKLLDFGLARPELEAGAFGSIADLTRSGVLMGTPRYMAPEQIIGDPTDARSDIFAAGAILFEMLAGRPAFTGRTVVEVANATLHEQPPALTGSPTVAAVDRVIRKSLAKRPSERLASADAMAEALRTVRGVDTDGTQAMAHMLTRLVVLPFRILRPDPETDFLAFSLPDAIATSLSNIGSLVIRSSAAAARFAGETPDLNALAKEVDVDRVVMGTLLRAGDQLRATTQLVEAPSGTLVTSHTVQSSLGDLFRLQDDIAKRVVEALALPLGGTTTTPQPDVPRDPRAYELYLRANEAARTYEGLPAARELYEHCLELDPDFAPAWAQVGRCHRVIGKFIIPSPDSEERAEEAFKRALQINPRYSLAHKFYAGLEADIGQSERAMARLLTEAKRHGNDPALFSGLVHACRYVGLYDESLAAHAEARRLDPKVETSFEQTLLLAGEVERLLAIGEPISTAGADQGIKVIALGLAGRLDEARTGLEAMRHNSSIMVFQTWIEHLVSWLDRRPDVLLAGLSAFQGLKIQDDPEAIFQEGWLFCDIGEHKAGLAQVQRAVAKGYYPVPTLARARQFDAVRNDPAFQSLLAQAVAGRDRAVAAFREAGGDRVVGVA